MNEQMLQANSNKVLEQQYGKEREGCWRSPHDISDALSYIYIHGISEDFAAFPLAPYFLLITLFYAD